MMAGVAVDSRQSASRAGTSDPFNSRGVIAISGRERTVSKEDRDGSWRGARGIDSAGREILHVLPAGVRPRRTGRGSRSRSA